MPSEAAASNGTSLTQMDQAHSGWPRWKKIVVGVFAGIGGVIVLALLSRLAFACFRWTKRRREDRRNLRDFNEMEVGGGGTFRQVNTARMQDSNTQPLHRSASAAHYNPPRPRRVQLSDHGPNDYTIAEEAVDGAWPPSYRSSEVDDDGGVSPIHAHGPAAGRSDYERRSRSAPLSPLERPYNRIPVPRAPARRSHPVLRYPGANRQATVEEYVEMQ
ncbi:hypothetical protein B0A55_13219 [Friedmanniomyces simplex]|uniref:Uncharacterized protein n=1 Tax=Friedmanniomyces simplex TaxID=329884 RepID=A0A4U0VK70_9PEZI|nr:hypothetical protein B0A55_13219 [Friedmanniomyces simplex]